MRPVLFIWLIGSTANAGGIGPALFRHHYIAREMPGRNVGFGTPALVDFDNDGDLDFAVYNRGDSNVYWFEYRAAGEWVRHLLGEVTTGQLGSVAMDVDGDGWRDMVIGGHWYRNPRTPRGQPFTRYTYDPTIRREIHDMVVADIDQNGKPDIVALGDGDGCFWYAIPPNPARNADWPRTTITAKVLDTEADIHSGFSPGGVADLDGDGDPDVVLPDRWLANEGGGKRWTEHPLLFGRKGPWGLSARSWITDVDADGDNDILIADSDGQNCGVAWLENNGGTAPRFAPHYFTNRAPGTRGSFHSMALADFDLDGDADLLIAEQEDPKILPLGATPRWYVWENLSAGGRVRFEERVVFEGRLGGHDVRAADVDGDGDIDVVSKIWNTWRENANSGRVHVDYFENTTR
ncbi:MAG: VCBS repeat-containing protein [bacterium]|nr:VCBS repeat-containing protein [bacterium]